MRSSQARKASSPMSEASSVAGYNPPAGGSIPRGSFPDGGRKADGKPDLGNDCINQWIGAGAHEIRDRWLRGSACESSKS